MSFDSRAVGPEQSDSVIHLWPNAGADFIRDELERVWRRAYDEWEFAYVLVLGNPALRANQAWVGLQSHLATRAENAFSELKEYKRGDA